MIFRSTESGRHTLFQAVSATFPSVYAEVVPRAKGFSPLSFQSLYSEHWCGVVITERMAEESTNEEKAVEEKQPPKKRAKKAQTPKKETNEEVENSDNNEGQKRKSKARGTKKRPPVDQPKTLEMVVEAIENLGDSKGSSVQAIKSYVMTNYKVRDEFLKSLIKKALSKALDQNLIVRPKSQITEKHVLKGRYMIRRKTADEIEPPKPRMSKLRQLGAKKTQKKGKTKRKKRRKGSY